MAGGTAPWMGAWVGEGTSFGTPFTFFNFGDVNVCGDRISFGCCCCCDVDARGSVDVPVEVTLRSFFAFGVSTAGGCDAIYALYYFYFG